MGNSTPTTAPVIESTPQADVTLAEKYSFALDLMKYQIQTLWTIFGIFLIAETVLLGALARIFNDGPKEIVFVGALIGLFLTIPWWTTFEYARGFYLLRINQAKQFEPAAGSLLTEGHDLSEGPNPIRGVKIGAFVRFMSHHRSGSYLIVLFAVTFFLIVWVMGNEIFKG